MHLCMNFILQISHWEREEPVWYSVGGMAEQEHTGIKNDMMQI
jgi:hypothetical protein